MEQLLLQLLFTNKTITSLKGYIPYFSPIHIEDCARALLYLIEEGEIGEDYILSDLQPISFTIEEAVTLLIGTDFIEQRFDDDYRDRANAARRRIEATLSDSVRHETSRIIKSLRLLAPGKQAAPSNERGNLDKIRRAILDGRKIRFHYSK